MKIFCSGIGGIGLSAYAGHMIARGHTVHGTDKTPSIITDDIREKGATVSFVQDGTAVPRDCDLFVYSEAIPESAPERTVARERGIPQMSYFKAVGELSRGGKVICIAGTHGKSSTTAMVAKVLIEAGLDPNVVVGTRMKDMGNTNWRASKSDLWVIEACEYRRSFHFLTPSVILLTNVDGDHFDAYRDIDDYRNAFVEFCRLLPRDGTVILHGNDNDALSIATKAEKSHIDADTLPPVHLEVPGVHMRANASLALALALSLGVQEETARQSLQSFSGTWRRMDIKGRTEEGSLVIDDYGHHPVEVSATLSAIREAYPGKRIICIFQPHTHDRTVKLLQEFAVSFKDADLLIVPNIYDARPDKDAKKVSVDEFISVVEKGSGVRVRNGMNLQETEKIIHGVGLSEEDVVVTMGAGDITALSTTLAVQPYLR
jgi:UDP-N-acetylmuramate--alanine ligase